MARHRVDFRTPGHFQFPVLVSESVSNLDMKRVARKYLLSALFVCSSTNVADVCAKNVEAITDTSVCEIMKKPLVFKGKLVRVKGKLESPFEYYGIADSGCGPIWVDNPDQKGISPRPNFKMTKKEYLKKMDRLISMNGPASVTVIGRLEGVDDVGRGTVVSDPKTPDDGSTSAAVGFRSNGFGHLGQYKARLVLKMVEEVSQIPTSQSGLINAQPDILVKRRLHILL